MLYNISNLQFVFDNAILPNGTSDMSRIALEATNILLVFLFQMAHTQNNRFQDPSPSSQIPNDRDDQEQGSMQIGHCGYNSDVLYIPRKRLHKYKLHPSYQ